MTRRRNVSEVHAEVKSKEAIELAEDGRTIGTIDPPTKVCTVDPSIEECCFVLAWKRIWMNIF